MTHFMVYNMSLGVTLTLTCMTLKSFGQKRASLRVLYVVFGMPSPNDNAENEYKRNSIIIGKISKSYNSRTVGPIELKFGGLLHHHNGTKMSSSKFKKSKKGI